MIASCDNIGQGDIAQTRARPHHAPQGVRKPPIQILTERQVSSIEYKPAIPVTQGLCELRRHLSPELAVKGFPLWSFSRVHRRNW